MNVELRILSPDESVVLHNVAPDVFDGPVHARWSADFLSDARHHLAVAIDAGLVVGMASAVHYVHPDKAPELWINEVAVAATHGGKGCQHAYSRPCSRADGNWNATRPGC